MTARNRSSQIPGLILRFFAVLLVLAFVMAAMPRPAQAACAFKYTVVSGDTLYGIAARYQVKFEDLVDVNKLKAPYLLYVGQVLCIPPGAVKPTGTPVPTGAAATASAASQKSPTITAQYMGTIAWVALTNFPKDRFFYIKIYPGPTHIWTLVNSQMGIISTDSKGQFAAYFHVPWAASGQKAVTICAKDALNDDVLACTVSYDSDYFLSRRVAQ
jgi:murein DD-endopeptidase MepM/ murein hydrolase activator NlpD